MVNGNENAMIRIVARKRAEDAIEKQFAWCRKKRRSGGAMGNNAQSKARG